MKLDADRDFAHLQPYIDEADAGIEVNGSSGTIATCPLPRPGLQVACGRPVGPEGICDVHLAGIEARLLVRLLGNACAGDTPSGRPCSGALTRWDVCSNHCHELARLALTVVAVEAPASSNAVLPDLNEQEARERLEAILGRRRFIPAADMPYVIPLEELEVLGRKVRGRSLIEGDQPIEFVYFERQGDQVKSAYTVGGSQSGKDMPMVSPSLYREIKHCLKYLPGFVENCPETGKPLAQPLYSVAVRLLKGEIGIGDIHWRRAAPEAARNAKPTPEVSSALDVEAVYAEYGPQLRDFVLRRTSDQELADEVMQETFLRVVQFQHTFVAGRPVWPWLSAIAGNTWASVLRRRGQHPILLSLEDIPEEALNRALPDTGPDMLSPVSRDELLSALGPRSRRTFALFQAGYSLEEIGVSEGATARAVKNVLYRARKTIGQRAKRNTERMATDFTQRRTG